MTKPPATYQKVLSDVRPTTKENKDHHQNEFANELEQFQSQIAKLQKKITVLEQARQYARTPLQKLEEDLSVDVELTQHLLYICNSQIGQAVEAFFHNLTYGNHSVNRYNHDPPHDLEELYKISLGCRNNRNWRDIAGKTFDNYEIGSIKILKVG